MAKKFDPPLEIDLGLNPRKISYRLISQAKKWAEEEKDAWHNAFSHPHQNYGHFYTRFITQQLNATSHLLASIESAENSPDDTSDPTTVVSHLQIYKNDQAVHSQSMVGSIIIDALNRTEDIPKP